MTRLIAFEVRSWMPFGRLSWSVRLPFRHSLMKRGRSPGEGGRIRTSIACEIL